MALFSFIACMYNEAFILSNLCQSQSINHNFQTKVIISEKSDIFTMNPYMSFWAGATFLAIWIVQCLFINNPDVGEIDDPSRNRRRLYFIPKYASFKSLLLLAICNDVMMILISFALLPSRTPKPLQARLIGGHIWVFGNPFMGKSK